MQANAIFEKLQIEVFNPLMKNSGFYHEQDTWWKSLHDFSLVVSLQKYWWSSDDTIDFRINLGLMLPSNQKNPYKKPEINELAVCVSQDSYLPEDIQLHKFKNSIGYSIKTHDDVSAFISIMRRDIERFILPQLMDQNTLEACINFYKHIPFWNQRLQGLVAEHQSQLMKEIAV
jgi:hypothetical protein